jgi:trimethylamine--corrinoid protein Co-methyltransferase
MMVENDPMRMQSRLNVISKPDMQWIHEASLKILAETGIVFHSEEALTICRHHGAKVSGKTVCFPKKLVRQVLESSPKTFRWKARNDEQSVNVGDPQEKLLLQPNSGPVFVQDLDHGRRIASIEDFANIIKLCHASDIVRLVGSFPVDPGDISPEQKHLYMMYEILKNTDKPLIGFETDGPRVRQTLDMVTIAMGQKDFLRQHHCVGIAVCPLSPLSYRPATCETIIEFAKQNQVIFFTAAIMAGFSGPISLFGTTILHNAEVLAGITLAQLVNPGNPVVYSIGSTVANMHNGNFITGSPEMMLIHLAAMQMGLEYYCLPTRSMCGMTDSKIIDCQLMAGILGGAHMIFECLGVLDAIMTTSYEKLMIDLEIIRRVLRIREGLDTSGKEQALESIQKIGHESGYIDHADTLANFRHRWRPTLSEWGTYEDWQAAGSQDVAARANRKYKEILEKAPQSLIDPEVDKALQAYIRHAT